MRLIKNHIVRKDGSGSVELKPEEPEDMWHCYNLIRPTDRLHAEAVRKITTEGATGSTRSERVHMKLRIKVTKLDFDPQAGQLHVSGQVVEENKWVKLGSFHTLDLELQRNFTLEKENGWDSVAIEALQEAIDTNSKAVLWAVVMSEGLANICLITEHQTICRQKIERSISKKRSGSTDHDKQLQSFYKEVFDSLLRHLDLSPSREPLPLLLASPGFTASTFQSYIKEQATTAATRQLIQLLPKITVAHSASGHLHSLGEVLASPAVTSKLSDTKFARETQLMDKFFEMMRKDDQRAWYGPKECIKAIERGAVGKGGGVLLISNSLFRSQEIDTRRKWVRVVDDVKDQEGEVRVLSSMHESGKRLEGLGGIAAILTYPIEDLDEGDEGYSDGGFDLEDPDEGSTNEIEGRRDEKDQEEIDFL